MMIEDNYCINIAVDGRHWAMVELGHDFAHKAIDKARIIQKRFPEAEVTLLKVTCREMEVEF